jgi:hypothetical protein
MCTKFFLAGTKVQWGKSGRWIMLDDTSGGMMLSPIRFQHVGVWTWTGLPCLSTWIWLYIHSTLSSNMHKIWLLLHFPEQNYSVSWKFHNKMVEKFQITGSAMGKRRTWKETKCLGAWMEWSTKKSFCILALLCGEYKASVHIPITLSKVLPYEAQGIQELFPSFWEPRNWYWWLLQELVNRKCSIDMRHGLH